jgi:hypothetical protein
MNKTGKIIIGVIVFVVFILLFLYVISKIIDAVNNSGSTDNSPSSTQVESKSSSQTSITLNPNANPNLNPSVPSNPPPSTPPRVKACADYLDTEKKLPIECYKLLWSSAGCTTELTATEYPFWDGLTKADVKTDIYNYATLNLPAQNKQCYNDYCRSYKDDDKKLSTECYRQLWENAGCTTELMAPEYPFWDGLTKAEVKEDIKNYATLNLPAQNKQCYNDYCKSFGPGDKITSEDCYLQLWRQAGCTTTNVPVTSIAWWNNKSRADVEKDIKIWATSALPVHKKYCYDQ